MVSWKHTVQSGIGSENTHLFTFSNNSMFVSALLLYACITLLTKKNFTYYHDRPAFDVVERDNLHELKWSTNTLSLDDGHNAIWNE